MESHRFWAGQREIKQEKEKRSDGGHWKECTTYDAKTWQMCEERAFQAHRLARAKMRRQKPVWLVWGITRRPG